MSELVSKKKSKKWIIFVVLGIVLVLGIAAGAFFISRGIKSSRVASEISAGNKYFDELEYEEAIAHYLAAIEIDPTNLDAYIGIYDAYNALADIAISEGDYDHAYTYYKEALSILKDGQNYIDSEKLDEMIEDLKKAKDDAKDKKENGSSDTEDNTSSNSSDANGDSSDTSGDSTNASGDSSDSDNDSTDSGNNTSSGSGAVTSSDNPEVVAELEEKLYEQLDDTSSDFSQLIFAMAVRLASDNQCNSASIIYDVIAGDPAAMTKWLLPSPEFGTPYSYTASWCSSYYWEDTCWHYAIPLTEAESAAYSICGKSVDLKDWDWASSGNYSVDYYDNTECIIVQGGWAGCIGPILKADTVSNVEYVGDYKWALTVDVHEYNPGYEGMGYDTFYSNAIIYVSGNEDSYFNFTIHDCAIDNVKSTYWTIQYSDFLREYQSTVSGSTYYRSMTYRTAYLDGDDIPELLISDGASDMYYVYTITNNTVVPYVCTNDPWMDTDNLLYIASGVGGTSGELMYIPYSGKLLINHTDQDYAGGIYYGSTEYFDGTSWYDVGESQHISRDENGQILSPDVADAISNGYINDEDYDYHYDAPGYDPDDNWQHFNYSDSYYLYNMY